MQTVDHFLNEYRISTEIKRINSRPDNLMADMPRHFKVRFRREGKSLTVYFSQGSGHTKDPVPADVLDSISGDAACAAQNVVFAEFCRDLGYDEDSRKAEKVFKACQRTRQQLERFMGTILTDELMYETERL